MRTQPQQFEPNQPVHVLFLVNRLYEWSQNFITRELTELNKLGLQMTIGARDVLERTDLDADERKLRSKYFPIRENPFGLRYAVAHLVLAATRPVNYLRAWKTLLLLKHKRSKFPRGIICLFRAAGVAKEIERMGITIIHAHFLTAAGEMALYLSKLTGIPFGATAYAMDLYVDNSGLEGKLEHAAYVNGTTRYNEHFIARLMPEKPERALTLHYGVHTSGEVAVRSTQEPFAFLAVGRLVPKKGFECLLDACVILKEKDCAFRCEIIGRGPLHESLLKRVQSLGLSDVVSLTGYVAPNEMANKYRSRDVLVAPCVVAGDGDMDGLPNVCLEAMSYGLPVISTTISGIPEVVEDRKNGWLVPPNDSVALAEAMAKAVVADDLMEMRKAAHRMVLEKFDVRKNVVPIKALLEQHSRT